ncbi:hypothetical protein BC567DRAFT_270946 [Phyllosticta citribraziliensis]
MADHIPNILVANLDTRAALQRGTVTTIHLPLSNALSQPHTVPRLPRRMLFTLSRTCALQLAKGRGEAAVTLPVDAAAPEALDCVVDWMLSTCLLPDATPVRATGSFGSRVAVYQAALALGIRREAVTELEMGLLEFAEDGPALGMLEVKMAVERLPGNGNVARALVKRIAGQRRDGEMRHGELDFGVFGVQKGGTSRPETCIRGARAVIAVYSCLGTGVAAGVAPVVHICKARAESSTRSRGL